jgi:hypothetical protein
MGLAPVPARPAPGFTLTDQDGRTVPLADLRGKSSCWSLWTRTDADIVHTSAVYFIGPGGTERYLAEPMADHTSSGAAYLPAGQIAAWGRGIALVARTLSS